MVPSFLCSNFIFVLIRTADDRLFAEKQCVNKGWAISKSPLTAVCKPPLLEVCKTAIRISPDRRLKFRLRAGG